MKNWEFDNKEPQYFSGKNDHCREASGSEDRNIETQPTSSKNDSSSCLCIFGLELLNNKNLSKNLFKI